MRRPDDFAAWVGQFLRGAQMVELVVVDLVGCAVAFCNAMVVIVYLN